MTAHEERASARRIAVHDDIVVACSFQGNCLFAEQAGWRQGLSSLPLRIRIEARAVVPSQEENKGSRRRNRGWPSGKAVLRRPRFPEAQARRPPRACAFAFP
jgi:hypothetical protein